MEDIDEFWKKNEFSLYENFIVLRVTRTQNWYYHGVASDSSLDIQWYFFFIFNLLLF